MQINKLYISLKHWLALPPHGLAGQACGPSVAPLAWPSSPRSFLVREKIISEILFSLDVVSHASAISHSRNMQPKSPQKKREKRERTILLSFSTLVLQSSTRLFQLVPGIADKMQC